MNASMFEIIFSSFFYPVSSRTQTPKRCSTVCLSVSASVCGVGTYRPVSPPSASGEFGKQLVAMAAVFCPPITSHFTWGSGKRRMGGCWVCTVWQIAAIWGEISIHWARNSKSLIKYRRVGWNNTALFWFCLISCLTEMFLTVRCPAFIFLWAVIHWQFCNQQQIVGFSKSIILG